MPRSKNPANYPRWYFSLLEAALASEEPIRVPFESRQVCNRNKSALYAYINALEDHDRKRFKEDNASPDTMFGLSFRKVKLTTEGEVLVLQNKDFTPDQLAIKAALAAIGVDTSSAPIAPAPAFADTQREGESEDDYLQRMSDAVHGNNQAGLAPKLNPMPPDDDEAAKLVAELFRIKTPTN